MKTALRHSPYLAALCAAVVTLAACAPLSSVKETTPHFVASAKTEATRETTDDFRKAKRLRERHPVDGIEAYLALADEAASQLETDPSDPTAREAYNYALQRIFSCIREYSLDPWHKTLVIGDYLLDYRPGDFAGVDPLGFELIPDDLLSVRSDYLTESATRDGIGAPLVAMQRVADENYREKFRAFAKTYYPVTGIARFKGRRCTLSIYDPLNHESVTLAGKRYPLAADFTSFLAVMMKGEGAKKLDLLRLLRPGQFVDTARLAQLQPYDPNRIPLVMVHGLMDSPVTWVPMLNYLRSDPEIRKQYQLWFFSYPSGYPYPYSAAILRDQLDAIEKVTPGRKPIVMMGHSMGGMITRLMLTDSGEHVWNKVIRRPRDEVNLNAEDREFLTKMLVFKSRPEISRAIFISAPHQGSELASNWVGRIGSSLVRLPLQMLDVGDTILKVLTLNNAGVQVKRLPNSIDTLSPSNHFVRAVAELPIRPGVPYHTIAGDRGRGDTPNSSDGVVPYWSSHLEGAESEKIVPSNHSAHQNPEAMEEVRRILLKHAAR